MKSRVRKIICLLLMMSMYVCVSGFGPTNDPVLNTEKQIVYKYYDIKKIQEDAKLNKNSNLVGEKVVFVGKVVGVEKNNKKLHINVDGSGNHYIQVNLTKAISYAVQNRVIIFGEIASVKDSIAIVDADSSIKTNKEKLSDEYYEYIEKENGGITFTGFSSKKEEHLNEKKISFKIPSGWKKLDGEKIFNSELIDKENAVCYRLADREYVGIFYFDYDNFVSFDSNKKEVEKIENSIIQNICPDEKDRIGIAKRHVPQETFKPHYAKKQDDYVAVYENYNVEFQFRETQGGLFVVVYMYDDNNKHSQDVIYMLRTVRL